MLVTTSQEMRAVQGREKDLSLLGLEKDRM